MRRQTLLSSYLDYLPHKTLEKFKNIKLKYTDIHPISLSNKNAAPIPIFLVGMPRSGTTLIEQILASHDNVFGAGELGYLRHIGK